MESRPLKLYIAKGPREGDELEFKPGSRIRIGRVVRGNNVAIKDAGISSKHLSIELDPSRSGNWILQDLGSSNGTFINGSSAVLSPNTPYTITDGDTIKIGESTSIHVKLDTCLVEFPQNPTRRLRRAASRREATTGGLVEKLGLKEAEESVKAAGVFKESEVKLGLKEAEEIVKDAGFLKESGVDLATTSINEVKNIDPEKESIAQVPRVSPRRTRGRKRKVEDGIGTNNNNNNCEQVKNDLGKNRTRASTRRKRNEEKDVEKLDPVPVVVASDNVNVEVSNLEEEEEEETGQPDEVNYDKLTVMLDSGGREKGNESAANGYADVGNSDLCADGKNGPSLDFTKLTLREWFDYLEVYLPKQIVDETEKSLAAMREKVERIKDYVKEQTKKNYGEP